MVTLAIGLIISAILLQLVAAVVPGLEFDGVGAVLAAAVVMTLVAFFTGAAFLSLALQFPIWAFVIIEIVVNTLSLLFASAVVSGMRITGGAAVITGVVLTVVDRAIPILVSLIRTPQT